MRERSGPGTGVMSAPGLHFMRDPTRAGSRPWPRGRSIDRLTVRCRGAHPGHDAFSRVRIAGFDPLYLACEGRVVAVVGREARRLRSRRCAPSRRSRIDRRNRRDRRGAPRSCWHAFAANAHSMSSKRITATNLLTLRAVSNRHGARAMAHRRCVINEGANWNL